MRRARAKDVSCSGTILPTPINVTLILNISTSRNEVSSDVYTTDVITKMFKEEGGKLFDSRSASLGHTLQGGIPSPMDRARAVRLSLKCMAFIEHHHQELLKQQARSKQAPPESAAVITIQGTAVQWVPVQDMVEHADMKNRRGKHAWWDGMRDLVEALVARPQILAKGNKNREETEVEAH